MSNPRYIRRPKRVNNTPKKEPNRKRRPAEFYVKEAEKLLIAMRTRQQSAIQLKKRFNINHVQATRYVTAAVNLLTLRLEKARGEHTADSYHFYVATINDENQRMCDRLRARESLDELLGIKGSMSPAGVTIDKLRETVALAVADALKMLAERSDETRKLIAKMQTELAEMLDTKYGTVDSSERRSEPPTQVN